MQGRREAEGRKKENVERTAKRNAVIVLTHTNTHTQEHTLGKDREGIYKR